MEPLLHLATSRNLCQCPELAVTNDHKLGSFKQQIFILHSAGVRHLTVSRGPPLLEALDRSCSVSLPASGGFRPSLALWPHHSKLCLCGHMATPSSLLHSHQHSPYFPTTAELLPYLLSPKCEPLSIDLRLHAASEDLSCARHGQAQGTQL